MTERRRLKNGQGGNYFRPDQSVDFFPSGSKLLNLALGGGWAERRVSNIIGDSSTGKTLLAIEAGVNFKRKYPKGKVRYREGEAAFSKDYVTTKLGMPLDDWDFGDEDDPSKTIEDLYEELEYRVEHSKTPELMIIDSLDSFSTRAELARAIDQASYGGELAKQMSALFRRINSAMSAKHITMMVISQIRDNVGVTYGRKWKRSGGHALTFYSSQTVVLKQIEKMYHTHRGIKRATGVMVEAFMDKCKVGPAFVEARFPILFGYGIDDEKSCINFLKKVRRFNPKAKVPELSVLQDMVEKEWVELQAAFDPGKRKYT